MRRFFPSLLILFVAFPSFAGVTYRVESTSAGAVTAKVAGEVRAEGRAMRMDITTGDPMMFKRGSIVISRDAGRTIAVYDPRAKTYFELSLEQLATSKQFAGLPIEVRNPKVNVRDGGAGERLQGHATRRTIVDSSYDVVATGLGMVRVITSTVTWTTDRIARDYVSFLQQQALRTGIPEVDRVLASHASALRGFPLKQVTTMRIVMSGQEMRTTTTTVVSAIRTRTIAPQELAAPAGYRKVASPLERVTPR